MKFLTKVLAIYLIEQFSEQPLALGQKASIQDKIIVRGVNVVDMTSGKILKNRTVILKEGRIQAVVKNKIESSSTEIDGRGKYLIPGLWDMHAHFPLTKPSGPSPLPLYLVNGVTGIRNMNNVRRKSETGKIRDSLNALSTLAPRVGEWGITVDGVLDLRTIPFEKVATVELAREAVHNVKNWGADFVKVYAHLSSEQYKVIVEECKKENLPFAGHVPYGMPIAECVELGQKSLEHLNEIHYHFSPKGEQLIKAMADSIQSKVDPERFNELRRKFLRETFDTYQPEMVRTLARVMKMHNTWMSPTIITSQTIHTRGYLQTANGRNEYKNVPENVFKLYLSRAMLQKQNPTVFSESDHSIGNWRF